MATEYESLYQDALREIKARGDEVGEPYFAHDGTRAVRINNLPHIDERVFTKAWSETIATDIMRESGRSRRRMAQPPIGEETLDRVRAWFRLIAQRHCERADFRIEEISPQLYHLEIVGGNKFMDLSREEIEAIVAEDVATQKRFEVGLITLIRG